MKAADTLRVAWNHIRETAVFFYANVVAITVGVLLVVVMLSMSVGLSRYVESLMQGDISAEMIEVSIDPRSGEAPPITAATVRRFETIPFVEEITPAVSSVFAELHAKERKAFISLASPEKGSDLPSFFSAGMQDVSIEPVAPKRKKEGLTPVLVPDSVYSEVGGKTAILHLTRSGGEALDIPVTLTVVPKTRFSRCYASLALMRRIRTWQDTQATAAAVFKAPDEDPAFVYDHALVYARAVDDVPAVRAELEKLGYRTASILDSVKRYRQILLISGVVLMSLGLIALFTGSVSIFNAAYAAVLRRLREFAIYKTYGATRRDIVGIVLAEAAITAGVAGVLGFAAGGGVCLLLQRLVRAEVSAVLFPIEWWLMLVAFATASLATLAASVIPALRAARLSPTEAMRA